MRIAIPFENGQIFQHLGRTPQFKLYDVEDGKVTDSAVVPTSGGGHGVIPVFLKGNGVGVVICGGLGGPMSANIEAQGIELFAGYSGSADAAVEAYIAGELDQAGNENATGCECHGGH